MPIYEYECANCGAVVDLKHAFREAPPTTACAVCGASPLKRLFRPAGIVFKGSGFYVNDSRSTSSTTKSDAPSTSSESKSPKGDAAA